MPDRFSSISLLMGVLLGGNLPRASAFFNKEGSPDVDEISVKISEALEVQGVNLEEHYGRDLQGGIFGICDIVMDVFDVVAPPSEDRDCSCNFLRQTVDCNYKSVSCQGKMLPSVEMFFKLGNPTTVQICQEFQEDDFPQVCVESELVRLKYETCRSATYDGKPCKCSACSDGMTVDIDCTEYHPKATTNGCTRLYFKDSCMDFAPIANRTSDDAEDETMTNATMPEDTADDPPKVQEDLITVNETTSGESFLPPVEVVAPNIRAADWAQADPFLSTYNTTKRIQRYALATLFYSTTANGVNWTKQEHWLSYDVDECYWYSGVSNPCSAQGDFEILNLTANGLVGPLVPELQWLTSMKRLIFPDNFLSGELPSEIASLTSLVEIDLQSSDVGGPLPSELGSTSTLESLSLQNNWFTGAVPSELGLLTNLTSLELQHNFLEGTIPAEVCQLISTYGTYIHVDCDAVSCTCGCVCS
jgi:hypothetical protein